MGSGLLKYRRGNGIVMKNKKVAVVIIVVLVAIVGYFVYSQFLAPKPEDEAKAAEAETSLEELFYYNTGDAYVTNVKDSKALSKISVSLALKGEGETMTEVLTTNNALIRSVIVDVMRDHTEDELRAVDATEKLSAEMLEKLKEALKMEDIVNVCISDYVIQ